MSRIPVFAPLDWVKSKFKKTAMLEDFDGEVSNEPRDADTLGGTVTANDVNQLKENLATTSMKFPTITSECTRVGTNSYYKAGNIVTLHLDLRANKVNEGCLAFILDEGFRPPYDMDGFVVNVFGDALIYMSVLANGKVMIYSNNVSARLLDTVTFGVR